MGVRVREEEPRTRALSRGPGFLASAAVFVIALLFLLANGRPIGDGDASGPGGWLWNAGTGLAGCCLELDATGRLIVGKLLASFFVAAAAMLLFRAVARRHTLADARWAALALALGTTLAAAAQAFSAEALAACGIAAALALFVKAECDEDPAAAGRAGLPLALAVAFQPPALPLAVVLAVGLVLRHREAIAKLLLWAVPGIVLAVAGLARASTPATGAETPEPLALLASPAKGAFVFAPVALVGLAGIVRSLIVRPRRRWDEPPASRALAITCLVAVAAHFVTVAVIGRWADGSFWGPRTLGPAWPPLLLFLPEGLTALRMLGGALLLVSFGVQALGALSYTGRWDRLNRDSQGRLKSPWSLEKSPIAFQLQERVARPSLLAFEGRRLVVREHAVVGGSETASFVSFAGGRPRGTGSDATMERFRLEAGAHVVGERLELRTSGDGVAFRVREGVRLRRLELRLVGSGRGVLGISHSRYLGDASGRQEQVNGGFHLRVPYRYDATLGPELAVTLRAGGPIVLESVALVPAGDPEKVLRLP